MANAAIIFDVDGVLLELTRAEEDLFFAPFATHCDTSKLSRDWNSYKIRNDEDITKEICARYTIKNPAVIKSEYLKLLKAALSGPLKSIAISGAPELLNACTHFATLGIATANFREAAKLRLQHAGLWHHVTHNAFDADGGGHKHEILARALATLNLPKSRIIYVGDNLNDVAAGLQHGVHFIGFSTSIRRLETLKKAGAKHLSSNHNSTRVLINTLLNLRDKDKI